MVLLLGRIVRCVNAHMRVVLRSTHIVIQGRTLKLLFDVDLPCSAASGSGTVVPLCARRSCCLALRSLFVCLIAMRCCSCCSLWLLCRLNFAVVVSFCCAFRCCRWVSSSLLSGARSSLHHSRKNVVLQLLTQAALLFMMLL